MGIAWGMKAAARRYAETNDLKLTDFIRWFKHKVKSGHLSEDENRFFCVRISMFLGELVEINDSKGGKE